MEKLKETIKGVEEFFLKMGFDLKEGMPSQDQLKEQLEKNPNMIEDLQKMVSDIQSGISDVNETIKKEQ